MKYGKSQSPSYLRYDIPPLSVHAFLLFAVPDLKFRGYVPLSTEFHFLLFLVSLSRSPPLPLALLRLASLSRSPAHSFSSPMHGMLSAVTLLTETHLTTEQRDLAGIIEESGSVLLQVINDILDYSKLSSGVFQLSCTEFSFKETINAVVRSTVIGLKSGLQVAFPRSKFSDVPGIPVEMLEGRCCRDS